MAVTTRCHFCSANFISAGVHHAGNVGGLRGGSGKRVLGGCRVASPQWVFGLIPEDTLEEVQIVCVPDGG